MTVERTGSPPDTDPTPRYSSAQQITWTFALTHALARGTDDAVKAALTDLLDEIWYTGVAAAYAEAETRPKPLTFEERLAIRRVCLSVPCITCKAEADDPCLYVSAIGVGCYAQGRPTILPHQARRHTYLSGLTR